MKLRYLLIFLLLVSCAHNSTNRKPANWFGQDSAIELGKQEIEKHTGKILSKNEAPIVYETLDPIFKNLRDAKKRLFSDLNTIFVEEFYVIDSPVLNAFVYQLDESGIKEQKNLVCVTTGLIELLTKQQSGESVEMAIDRGILEVAGVIAHELAHPVNKLSGQLNASQAEEIRADIEGTLILKEAGYPEESLINGLKNLFRETRKKEKNRADGIMAAAATHPEQIVRTSAQRLSLTYQRYFYGSNLVRTENKANYAIREEILEITNFNKDSRSYFNFTQNIDESMDNLIKLLSKDYISKESFHKNIIDLDSHIIKMNQADVDDLTMEQIEKYTKIISLSMKHEKAEEITTPGNEFSEKYQNIDFSSGELRKSNHPFFKKSEFVKYFKRIYENEISELTKTTIEKNSGKKLWNGVLATTGMFINKNEVIDTFKKDYTSFVSYLLEESPHLDYVPFSKDFLGIGFLHETYADIYVKFKNEDRLSVLHEIYKKSEKIYDTSNYSHFNPLTYMLRASKGKVSAETYETANKVITGEQRDTVKEISRQVWINRGAIASSEFFRNQFGRVYWKQIFKNEGIKSVDGLSYIRKAFLDFVQTEEFEYILRTRNISSSSKGFNSVKESFLPSWVDKNVIEELLKIYDNKFLNSNFRGEYLKKVLLPALTGHPGLFRRTYSKLLKEEFNAYRSIGKVELSEIISKANEYFDLKQTYDSNKSGNDLEYILLDILEDNKEKIENYKELVRELYVEGSINNKSGIENFKPDSGIRWQVNSNNTKSVLNVTKKLKKNQIIEFYFESLKSIYSDGVSSYSHYEKISHLLREDLVEILKLNEPRKSNLLIDLSKVFINPYVINNPDGGRIALPIGLRKSREDIFTLLLNEKSYDLEQSVELFRNLNFEGNSRLGDDFFNKFILPHFSSKMDDDKYATLSKLLKNDTFFSAKLKAKLSKLLMNRALIDYVGIEVSDSQLSLILNQLSEIFPEQGVERDELLEDIAWKLDLRDKNQLGLVESFKSYNWQTIDTKLVNKASMISEELSNMDSDNIKTLLSYILDPKNEPMPKATEKWLSNHLRDKFDKRNERAVAATLLEERMFILKDIIEVNLAQAKPMEKIPFVEMLLNMGDDPIMTQDYFNVFCKLMNRSKNDPNNKVLNAFLNSIPRHEISTTLAYLMVNDGEGGAAIKSTFEAFGPVGKKAAQMAAIWELLDKHLNEELEDLKDSAKPLSKGEIENILRSTLSDVDYKKIKKVKGVVGSASIKTVVEIEMSDGRTIVGMLQSPQAANLIESNIVFAKKFLKELAQQEVEYDANVIAGMIKDIESQLHLELDMKREALKIREAQAYYGDYNKKFSKNVWKINVPSLISDFESYSNVLFVEKADGVSFNKLSKESKILAGKSTVHSSVYGIFNEGWFDKDRHKGNFFYDEKRKIIHVIDFGQATRLSNNNSFSKVDDRLILSELFRGIDDKSSTIISRSLADMTKKKMSTSEIKDLDKRIGKLISEALPMKSFMAKMVNLMPEIGFPLEEKYSFETLKALMILYGENYISEAEFSVVMKELIKSTYKKKIIPSCRIFIKDFFSK